MRPTGATIQVLCAFLLLLSACARGQAGSTNMLPNPSFEELSGAMPDGWDHFGFREHRLRPTGHTGERSVSIEGTGTETGWWYAKRWDPIQRNRLYAVSYWVRGDARGSGGSVYAGLNQVIRRDTPSANWEKKEFFVRASEYLSGEQFRMGQAGMDGVVHFDDVGLHPAIAVHRSRGLGRYMLGSGETISGNRYTAFHEMDGVGSSDCRFLHHFRGTFDSDHWVLSGRDEVVYKHDVSYWGVADREPTAVFGAGARRQLGAIRQDPRALRSLMQGRARVEVEVARCEGVLSVQFSRNGEKGPWQYPRLISSPGNVTVAAPASLLPTRELWVRLVSVGASRIEVTRYQYSSLVSKVASKTDDLTWVVGDTHYLRIEEQSAAASLDVIDVGDLAPGGRSEVRLLVGNRGGRRKVWVSACVQQGNALISWSEEKIRLGRGAARQVYLPYKVAAEGEQVLRVAVVDADSQQLLASVEAGFTVAPLRQGAGGEEVGSSANVIVWWCEPERKVSLERPAPTARGEGMRLSAAGNEYEAAQIVLTPKDWLRDVTVTASDLVSEAGGVIPAAEVRTCRVGYVSVSLPTDEGGETGKWPDPLLPQEKPADLAPGINHPYWVTVHVPAGTPKGDYRGEVAINARGLQMRVPLLVHVWGFELPRETHLRAGCGLSTGLVRRYHNLDTKEELRRVVDLYVADFALHRVTPVGVGRPIRVDWRKEASGRMEPILDFQGFDEDAHQALDEFGFSLVTIKPPGLGARSYGGWHPGEIGGFEQGTPQHEAAFACAMGAIEEHLRQRGWLSRTYVLWLDEPDRRDLWAVREGMQLVKRTAPELKRMLTAAPSGELEGAADAWCVPASEFSAEAARERQAAGEEVWWWLDREAKAPHMCGAIDHQGTEVRLWGWQAWKYGVDGIWLSSANHWHSSAAYAPGEMQDPWQEAMSWASDVGMRPSERVPVGNGYGRLLYPPRPDSEEEDSKRFAGPVSSLRWELLRDGLEDYEYFWLLRAEVDRLKRSGADGSVYGKAEKLLEVPADVCEDVTHFATAPEPIQTHRAKVAEAIEELRRQ